MGEAPPTKRRVVRTLHTNHPQQPRASGSPPSGAAGAADCATLGWIIRRKLRGGRLPRVWPLILSADSGSGETCDACDKPMLPAQMMMTLRGRDQFVRLHADCFLLWHDIRSETAEAPERVTGR